MRRKRRSLSDPSDGQGKSSYRESLGPASARPAGKVLAGLGDVNASTRAAAIGSARTLNSPTGVMFPATLIAPPMTNTSFARRKVCRSWEAAIAKLVKGPSAIRVMVSGGFDASSVKISSGENFVDGTNECADSVEMGGLVDVVAAAEITIGSFEGGSGGGGVKREDHMAAGAVNWGCVDVTPPRPSLPSDSS